MAYESQKIKRRYVYIVKWLDEVEKYVKYNSAKKIYQKVIIAEADQFDTVEEAGDFVKTMNDLNYENLEIVPVEVKPIA